MHRSRLLQRIPFVTRYRYILVIITTANTNNAKAIDLNFKVLFFLPPQPEKFLANFCETYICEHRIIHCRNLRGSRALP